MPLRGTCSQLGLVREHRSQPLKTTAALHVPSSTNTHNTHKYILLHILCTEVKHAVTANVHKKCYSAVSSSACA